MTIVSGDGGSRRRPWIVPIPGTTKAARLAENLGAAALRLDGDDLAEIEQGLAGIKVEGARYPEQMLRLIDGADAGLGAAAE